MKAKEKKRKYAKLVVGTGNLKEGMEFFYFDDSYTMNQMLRNFDQDEINVAIYEFKGTGKITQEAKLIEN